MDSQKIGKYISALRKKYNWTQVELAEKLSVSDKAVSKWESGNGLPDITILPLIAETFDITVDELLKGESVRSAANESIFAKIAAGDSDLLKEMGNGLNIDKFDEYGKSLADRCAEKNNIKVFRLLIKLNKVHIANRTETHIDSNGKETLTYEDVVIYDRAYYTGDYNYPYPKNYSDSALVCLAIKNRADEILKQLNLGKHAFTQEEADCIANDFDYFYENYFKDSFPSYIGALLVALVKQNKLKESNALFDIIRSYKDKMEMKRAECEMENNTYGKSYNWSIDWNTGTIRDPIYDKDLKKYIVMRNKIMAYVWGTNIRPYILGDAVVITQDDLVQIGFANPQLLTECKELGYTPALDCDLLTRLLAHDDIKIFDAFTAGQTLNAESEKLVLNSAGKIRTRYFKSNTPKSINDVISVGDIGLVSAMLATPKATLQYSKEVNIESLGKKEMLPVLKKFLPFLERNKLDDLLNRYIDISNMEARILLIEAGAKILTQYTYPDNDGGTYCEWKRDDLQTEILYKTLKSELK